MGQNYSIEQLNHGRKVIDFMRYDILAFIVSSLLILASIIIINIRGFNWGLDFTGGIIIEINLEKPVTVDLIRKELFKANFNDPLVQKLGGSRDIIIRLALIDNHHSHELGNKVISIIKNTVHQNIVVKRIDFVGPSIGKDLAYSGIIAILSALFSILIYIGFRFEWCLALSTVLSLIHDLIINCGILSLFHIEIDLTILASLMSVITYSLNDKIVVSDRIRENFRKIRWGSAKDITNVSLTQTLNRTLITSLTTLAIILILFIFGGTLLTGFSLTMLIGVSIGTFSSIYISSALALRLGMKREYMLFKKVDKKNC